MFFQQTFLSAILFSCVAVYAYARNDIITLFPVGHETKVVSCPDCPIPGKECRSYILTSTDKICLSSYTPTNSIPVEKVNASATLHQEANERDAHNLESGLNFSAHHVSDSVADVSVVLEKEPFVE